MGWRWAWQVGVSSAADGAVTTGVVACMHVHTPSFSCACTHCCSSTPFPAIIDLCPCIPFCVHLHWSPFVPAWLLSCALHYLFMLIWSLFVPACLSSLSCLFVPFATRLCLSGPHLSLHICVCSFLVPTTWLCLLMLVGVCLGSFELVWLLYVLI